MAEKVSAGQTIVALAILGGGAWYFWGGGLETHTQNTVAEIQSGMTSDFIKQYEILKRQGSKTDVCMHSNMVKGSYLGAKDEANFVKWKQIAAADCRAAGIPIE